MRRSRNFHQALGGVGGGMVLHVPKLTNTVHFLMSMIANVIKLIMSAIFICAGQYANTNFTKNLIKQLANLTIYMVNIFVKFLS